MNDFAQLAELQDLAFEEKRGLCQPISDCRRAYQQAYEFYAKSFPHKLQHCRIIKQPNTKTTGPAQILGAIQLQLPGDPGDMSFCADGMRNSPNEEGGQQRALLAYIEWIACHPDHTGKGIGTALLEWAVEHCRQTGMHSLSLQVGGSNHDAVRLYTRHGFVTTTQPGDDAVDVYCLGPLYVYCCLGFKHTSLLYMERRLADSPTEKSNDDDESDCDSIRSFRILEDDASEGHFINDSHMEFPSTRKTPPPSEIPGNGMERE
jgi:ribosomal protein S18 acetylase RimI-like enzyme